MASVKYTRLFALLEFLKRKKEAGASAADIKAHLEQKFDQKDLNASFSERTFERDKKEILDLFGVKIIYIRNAKVYKIDDDDESIKALDTLIENNWLMEAVRNTAYKPDSLLFEDRPSRGLEWLTEIISAIKDKNIITFNYHKFKENTISKRIVEAYAIKEFNYHWYLLANEHNTEEFQIKTFALDRISNLKIEEQKFRKKPYSPEKAFANAYGIILKEENPIEIQLRFDRHQGNFMKVRPLHHSQKIVSETDTHLIIKIILVPTYDFDQKILSMMNRVEVLSPPEYRNKIKMYLNEITDLYSD